MSVTYAYAPPGFWGPWQILWTRLGVVGPDQDRHRSVLNVVYPSQAQAPSTFDIQIDDGERVHRMPGPGRHRVVILGNEAVQVRVRCKSNLFGQTIKVNVERS